MSAIKSLFNVTLTVAALSSMGVGINHMYQTGAQSNQAQHKVHSTTTVQKVIHGKPFSVDGPYAASGGRGKVVDIMGPGMEYGAPASELTADINKVRNALNHLQTGFTQTVIDPSMQAAADVLGANANTIIISQQHMETAAKKGMKLVTESKEKITTLVHGMDM